MAGDWIKIEHTTPDKPEVVKLASILNIDQDAVVGKLIRVWVWADQNSVDGNDVSVTDSFLDRLTFCNGFSIALRNVGWLIGKNGCLMLPNFERHNGQTSKSRAVTNRRVSKHRSTCNASTVTNETHEALEKPLPEKRREEKSINNSHPYSEKPDLSVCVPPERLNPIPDSEAFAVFLKAICDLRPAWERVLPHGVEVGLAKELYESVKGTIKPSDMALLKAYLNDTKTPRDRNNEKFWRPEGRKSFIENFAGILTSADRWKKETKWKPFKAPVKQQQQEEAVSDEQAANIEDFRELLK